MSNSAKQASVIITSINSPTLGVQKIASMCLERNWSLIVIGDKKSPKDYSLEGSDFYSTEDQEKLGFELGKVLPYNTYSRKMLGYLIAAENSVDYLIETDDDNIPYENFLDLPELEAQVRTHQEVQGWLNCYNFFTDDNVWPRGFPLDEVSASRDQKRSLTETFVQRNKFIQQALADGDPDVDAIYRLTFQTDTPITFRDDTPLLMLKNQISPFNSQATTWPIELFPLMYLPVTCSFRMTDIWRSYICQKILQRLDFDLVIVGPRLLQVRNAHDLMKDFSDEIEGYLGYKRFQKILEEIKVIGKLESMESDLKTIYRALTEAGFFKEKEMKYLLSWLGDIRNIRSLEEEL